MICSKCGNQNGNHMHFCGACGAPLIPPSQMPANGRSVQQPQKVPNQPKKNKTALVITLVAVLAIVAVAAVWFFMGSNSETDAQEIRKIKPDEDSVSLQVGETYQVEYKLSPKDAEGDLEWESDDESVAKVSRKGVITAVDEGTCTILITADSGAQAELEVSVKSNTTNEENIPSCYKPNEATPEMKVGVILIGDQSEAYSYSHILGIREAVANLGLTENDNIIWKYYIGEDETCYDAIVDCIDKGCKLVITNSYGHQSFAMQAAEDFPDIQIVAMTGDTAGASCLDNFHNAFTEIYEARYAAGVVAGLKIAELVEQGKLTASNYDAEGKVKVGYVGAFPYAEVISGYTAFFLGIRSVYDNVTMDVLYTYSWLDNIAEKAAADQLIDDGCVIIGQHSDSTGAPSACESAWNSGTVVYSVGYNIDMLSVAPNAALVSPTNVWSVYYTEIIGAVMNGEAFSTDWAEGYDKGAVKLTELGESCAEGTEAKVNEVIEQLKNGTLHVFDTSAFTIGGQPLTSAFATDSDGDWVNDCDEAVFNGYYHESYFHSAPYFALRIDGITEQN